MEFTLTPDGDGTPVVLTFEDQDGDGGKSPTIKGGTLNANTTYKGALVLLNKLESPTGNITEEIKKEELDHQFFFKTSNFETSSQINVAYDDKDAKGNPIGLSTLLTTKGIGKGTITVILRHKPDKSATNVSTGDITNAGGETDIEVTFDVEVQ